tara:strand:+ start:271 stop:1410 length:1140 start_codon:yes stop_codon:yes gene_type:complete
MKQHKNHVHLLLKGKARYGKKSTLYLGQLVHRYPYAPIFHFLYLRSLQEEDSYKFPSQLNRSSVSTMNRSALFDWAEEPLVPMEVQMAAVKKRLSDQNLIQSEIKKKHQIQISQEYSDKNQILVDKESKKIIRETTVKTETTQVEKTSIEALDLSSLPDKVRAQIIRSRAIKEQLSRNRKSDDTLDLKENKTPKKQKKIVPKEIIEKKHPSEVVEEIFPFKSNEKNEQISLSNTDQDSNLRDKITEPKKKSKFFEQKDLEFTGLSPFAQFLHGLNKDGPKDDMGSSRDRSTERKILQQFLELNPKISPVRGDENTPDLTLKTPNVSGLVTETLANHYYDQGAFVKAIQAYEILKLKVPQKSSIFAARISEMRNLQFDKK